MATLFQTGEFNGFITTVDEEDFLLKNFEVFAECLVEARQVCLRQEEADVIEEIDLSKPLNPRHEAAALSLLLRKLQKDNSLTQTSFWKDYNSALNISHALYKDFSFSQLTISVEQSTDSCCSEAKLKNWVASKGGRCRASAAEFMIEQKKIRGLAATVDLLPGETVLSIPKDLLINEHTAAKSELGKALTACGVPKGEVLTVIWTMIDSQDPESEYHLFWATLPKQINSGLSFSSTQVEYIEGTSAAADIIQSQEHLRSVYTSIEPLLKSLHVAYPDYVTPSTITYSSYIRAVQIWYSYAMEVEVAKGEVCSCLVPFASLMNHSPWPHCVRYGRLNDTTSSLEFQTFRACGIGEQVLLSYGPLPNQKLLVFYGFVSRNNPFDSISLELQIRQELEKMDARKRTLCLQRMEDLNIRSDLKMVRGSMSKMLLVCVVILSATIAELGDDQWTEDIFQDPEHQKLAFTLIHSWLKCLQSRIESTRPWEISIQDEVSQLCMDYLNELRELTKACMDHLRNLYGI